MQIQKILSYYIIYYTFFPLEKNKTKTLCRKLHNKIGVRKKRNYKEFSQFTDKS
ncbi:hypothetical protein JHK87_005312 [Glycine soja]|nr:hypothetical protein JHK87_005312 [Glycine soja]